MCAMENNEKLEPTNSDRFTIYCRECEDDRTLIEISNDTYECPQCTTTYSSEDGVMDHVYAAEMYLSYKREQQVKKEICSWCKEVCVCRGDEDCCNPQALRDVDFIRDEMRYK